MEKKIYTLLLVAAFYVGSAQITDRYPIIQSPNENSVVIGWNNATAGVGTVKWGPAFGSLTNTVSEQSPNQVHGITISGLEPNTKYYCTLSD